MNFEGVTAHTKSRWSRIRTGSPQEQLDDLEENGPEEEQTDEEIIREEEHRMVFNPDSKVMDLRRLRTTDIKDCPRLILPPARPQTEEMEMAAKEQLWLQRYSQYMSLNCNAQGKIRQDNMTKSERAGLKKLLTRKKTNEIIISKTDKSSKNTVSSRESYLEQGATHVKNDLEVTWKIFEKTKREVLAHTRALTNVFNMGEDMGEKGQNRLKRALHEDISVIPNLILNQKDHKDVDKDTGLPKTRPVCEASCTHNQRCSNLLTDIMGATFECEDTSEAISTEDLLSKIDVLNEKIKSQEMSPKS